MNRWVAVEPAGGGKDGAVADNAKGVSVSFSLSPSKKRRVVAGTGTAHSAVPKRTTTGSVFQQQQHISDRGRIQGAAASAGAGAGAAAAPQPQHPQQRLPPNSSQSSIESGEGQRGPSKPRANLKQYRPTDYGSAASSKGPRYRPSAEKLSRLLFGKHAAVLGCLQASVEGTPCSQSCCQFWNPDNQVPPRGWIAPPQRRRFPAATPEDVALIVQLYGWGYSIMHPHDTRHCKEVLPYDKNAMQLLRDLDMERIPAQLIGVLTEAAQRQSWNGSITIEVRDYRADHLDLNASRKRKALMPGIRRIRLHPTQGARLHELQALCKDHRPKAQTTWTDKEWVGIESRVLRNVQDPICLNPSVLVFCLANVAHYNKSKYAALNKERFKVQLNQERAVRDVKEEEVVPGVVRPEHSRLVSFLTRGMRVRARSPAPASDEPRPPAAANQPIPTPPTNTGTLAMKEKAAPTAGERYRGIEFISSEGVPMLGSAFVPQPDNAAEAPKKQYRRNFVEMQQCPPPSADVSTVAPDNTIQHGPDFVERWQVCVRATDEAPFTPELSYTFSSAAEANAACDELKKVFTTYEKRGLRYDAAWGGINEKLLTQTDPKKPNSPESRGSNTNNNGGERLPGGADEDLGLHGARDQEMGDGINSDILDVVLGAPEFGEAGLDDVLSTVLPF